MQWTYNGTEFKAGDKVRVVREAESLDPNGMGFGVAWENTWVAKYSDSLLGMEGYLGHTFVIDSIQREGVEFEDAGDLSYMFPLASLDMVQPC